MNPQLLSMDELQAIGIVVRQMSDRELEHEAKLMRQRAAYAQGLADKCDREIKRRKRLGRVSA
jgi:hypothetical protein